MHKRESLTRLGIVTGLAFEAELLEKTAARQPASERPLIACAGLGRDRAQRAAKQLVAQGAAALMSTGVAGGLDPSLEAGALVLADKVIGIEGDIAETDPSWRSRLEARFGSESSLTVGPIAENDAPLARLEDKLALRARTNAAAVDMESYGVGLAAAEARIPFLAVRAIADTSCDVLPKAAIAGVAPDGTVRVASVLWEILKRPGDALALNRLARNNAAATRALRDFARLGLPFFGLV